MAQRIRVGVFFGGQSGEHEVSLASAYSVMTHLDRERFDVVPIGIAKDGRWLVGGDSWSRLRSEAKLALGPGEEEGAVPRGELAAAPADADAAARPMAWLEALDVAFPVLHGPYGEDGTIQGLFELVGIPYVGCGVAGSAVGMDKILCKRLLAAAGIPQVEFEEVARREWEADPDGVLSRLARLGLPCFVKPANLGSSVGISKVREPAEWRAALHDAARFDRRVIVEAAVPRAREIEVSVLGNEEREASVPGEIVPCNEFYDYDAKYVDERSELRIPAPLPEALADRVRALAVEACRALHIEGLARVDFLIDAETDEVFLNEPNTLPGFTPISMYPKLWAASGLAYDTLLSRLVDLALERHADQRRNATSI